MKKWFVVESDNERSLGTIRFTIHVVEEAKESKPLVVSNVSNTKASTVENDEDLKKLLLESCDILEEQIQEIARKHFGKNVVSGMQIKQGSVELVLQIFGALSIYRAITRGLPDFKKDITDLIRWSYAPNTSVTVIYLTEGIDVFIAELEARRERNRQNLRTVIGLLVVAIVLWLTRGNTEGEESQTQQGSARVEADGSINSDR